MLGNCPTEILNLRNLELLDLSGNPSCNLWIPETWNSTFMRNLDISESNFTGTIPTTLVGDGPPFRNFFLNNNNLNGTIPPISLSWSTFEISNNQLFGNISFSGNMMPYPSGIDFSVSHNQFDSLFIDTNYRNISIKFSTLDLSVNNFTSIPPDLLFLTVENLNLSSNRISGIIPTSALATSRFFYLQKNQINGFSGNVFPSTRELDLSFNKLTNLSLEQFDALQHSSGDLILSNCGLSFNVSSIILGTSFTLDLSRNNLTGVINLGSFTGIFGAASIDVSHNPFLTGVAPNVCPQQTFKFFNTSIYDPCMPTRSSRSSISSQNGNDLISTLDQNLENALIGGIVGGAIVLLCIIFLMVLAVFVILRRKRQTKIKQAGDEIGLNQQTQSKSNDKEDQSNYSPISKPQDHLVTENSNSIPKTGGVVARIQSQPKIAIDDPIKKYEIIYSEIEFEKKIGSGNFGEVWKGQWRGSDVAIKKLLAQDENTAFKEFASELAVMLQMRAHENVIMLKGFCVMPRCIITQFVEGGDLLKHLQTKTSSEAQLIHFCEGIAKGLLHLHEEGIVHRDLAARNILISDAGEQLEAIISDFGLSRDVSNFEEQMYFSQATTFPLKWLAPECLSNRVFTTKTDVWAYGCTVVEIFDSGKLYDGIEDRQALFLKVREGLMKPTIPSKSPKFISEILAKCFEFNPETRVNMQHVCSSLQKK